METVAFIGVGNLGLPMAANLVKAGHSVAAFDVVEDNLDAAVKAGCRRAEDVCDAARTATIIITMVPSGKEVKQVCIADGMIEAANPGSLFIDCSTVDMASASLVKEAARASGHDMVDAPVSGGSVRAAQGKLTIMVGGNESAFAKAEPVLSCMADSVQHLGGDGTGLAAKICNNIIAGASLAAVSEAFVLAERFGLEPRKFYEVASRSSGQCWALNAMCPAPGIVPDAPSSNGYKPGGAATMLMKDLAMAQDAAAAAGMASPMSSTTLSLYTLFCNAGLGDLDVSAIIKLYSNGLPVGHDLD